MAQIKDGVVETRYGKLHGSIENQIYIFRGIPYAAPPVAGLRWLAPQPLPIWSGIRPAEKYGPIARQMKMELSMTGPAVEEEPQSEDCLFLNVFTPGLDDKKRPVMVWIHGGAYNMGSGSSAMHPGSTLPKRGNVVFVSLNYRLGPLGFLYLNQATNGQIPNSGNEGLLDQIAALRWVKENIAVFGGDPGNITVFGESAGAMSIGCLLAMPAARGLFQKAILQSGASTVRTLSEAVANAEKYLGVLGIKGSESAKLLGLNSDYLIDGLKTMTGGNLWSLSKGAQLEPVIDGQTLPQLPLDAFTGGSAKGVTIMAGSNLDEATIFTAMDRRLPGLTDAQLIARLEKFLPSDFVADLVSIYQVSLAQRGLTAIKPYQLYHAIFTDLQFRMPATRLVESQTKLNVKAYAYIFDWPCPISGFGACHSLELGFLFGNHRADFHGEGPAAEKLAAQIQDAWIAFAHSGDPSCGSLGRWPAYGKGRSTMLLGAQSRVEAAPYEEERLAWEKAPNAWLG